MIRGEKLEQQVYEQAHIDQVLDEIGHNFPIYWKSFASQPLEPFFKQRIQNYEKDRLKYREYLDLRTLGEFKRNPGPFKGYTRSQVPVIHGALFAQDEAMEQFKRAFGQVTGKQLLAPVTQLAEFAGSYLTKFDDERHESATSYSDLGLEPLNSGEYQCPGVIGYGIQSSMLYGVHARCFAHRSQNAVWSLFFLSGRQNFGLEDGSEFMMVQPAYGTCEQNFFYPAELFGFYALRLFLMVKSACQEQDILFDRDYRYTYLDAFCDHVADQHRNDINTYKWSSEHADRQYYT